MNDVDYIWAMGLNSRFFPCSREPPGNPAVRVSHCKDSRIPYWRWDDHTQNKELIDPGKYKVVCFQGSIRQRHGLFVPYVISRTLNSWHMYLHLFNLHGKCRKFWHTLAGFVFLHFFYQYIIWYPMIWYMKVMSNAYQYVIVGCYFHYHYDCTSASLPGCILSQHKKQQSNMNNIHLNDTPRTHTHTKYKHPAHPAPFFPVP